MRFTTTVGPLRDALSNARRVTGANTSLVAYTGVMLAVRKSQLAITGSDGDTTITALVDVADPTDGQALLPPKPLAGYLSSLDKNLELNICADGPDLVVAAPTGAPYRFRTIAQTFPQPPAPRAAPIAVDLSELARAFAAVRAASGKNLGIQVVSDDTTLVLNATDGYRLAQARIPGAGFGEFSGALPLPVLENFCRHPLTHMSSDQTRRMLRGVAPMVRIVARGIVTDFPAVDTIIGAQPPSKASVDVALLRAALVRLSAVAADAPVELQIAGDRLCVTARNIELGEGSEYLELAEPSSGELRCAVAHAMLADALDGQVQPEVTLSWSGPLSPIYLRSRDSIEVTYVVMPMRL